MLKNTRRYSSAELEEGQYESGSRNRVLKNLLGIKKRREMDQVEFDALQNAMMRVIKTYGTAHQLSISDISNIHSLWLEKIYAWAGNYRQVNMSKAGFQFAAASLIPRLMQHFEKDQLKRLTPCRFSSEGAIAQAIAEVHVEFILIHPFREGNGRLARILSNLMALQAGLPLLDFGGIKGKKREEYFAAVRAGLDRNYVPMTNIFRSIIKRTLKYYRC